MSATFWTAPSLRRTRAEPARPKHEVELAALHALFEYAESDALAHVEHSINAVVGLPQLFGRADLGYSESLQLVAEDGVIGRRVLVRQPHESLREPLALLLVRSADFLEGLQLQFCAGLAVCKDWMTKPDDLMAAAAAAMATARSRGETIEVYSG